MLRFAHEGDWLSVLSLHGLGRPTSTSANMAPADTDGVMIGALERLGVRAAASVVIDGLIAAANAANGDISERIAEAKYADMWRCGKWTDTFHVCARPLLFLRAITFIRGVLLSRIPYMNWGSHCHAFLIYGLAV